MPVSPNRSFALQLCRSTFSGVIAPEGWPQGRGQRHYMPLPPTSVKKNILRIFYKKLQNSSNFGKYQSHYCDDLRRPRRDASAALQLPENSSPGSQEPAASPSRTFTIFHGFGENHSRSCLFLLNQKILFKKEVHGNNTRIEDYLLSNGDPSFCSAPDRTTGILIFLPVRNSLLFYSSLKVQFSGRIHSHHRSLP